MKLEHKAFSFGLIIIALYFIVWMIASGTSGGLQLNLWDKSKYNETTYVILHILTTMVVVGGTFFIKQWYDESVKKESSNNEMRYLENQIAAQKTQAEYAKYAIKDIEPLNSPRSPSRLLELPEVEKRGDNIGEN